MALGDSSRAGPAYPAAYDKDYFPPVAARGFLQHTYSATRRDGWGAGYCDYDANFEWNFQSVKNGFVLV